MPEIDPKLLLAAIVVSLVMAIHARLAPIERRVAHVVCRVVTLGHRCQK